MSRKQNILTPEECRSVIARYLQSQNFEVLNYHEEILPTPSVQATFHSITINAAFNSSNREVRLVAKRFENPLLFPIKDAYAKEIFSHEILFNAFKNENEKFNRNFTPACVFTKGTNVIVVEDLFEKGFEFIDNTAFDVDHIKLTLKTLAGYHAGSIVLEEKRSKEEKKYRLSDEYDFPQTSIHILESAWFKARLSTLNSILDLLPQDKLTHEEFKKGLSKLAADSLKTLKSKHKFRNVLCHGYMWGNNVMFRHKEKQASDCKLINFELQHYNPPALDVLQFIYSVTTREMRKMHFHEFIQFYYDSLKYELGLVNLDVNKLIPLEKEFELCLHQLLPIVKLQAACFHQIVPGKMQSSLFEDDSLLTHLFKTEESFRKTLTWALQELQDVIITPALSVEDCFKIVANKIGTANYEFLNYKVTPVSQKSGYLGEHTKLAINISVNNQTQTLKLFAKFMPKGEAARSIVEDISAFYKEIFMYQYFIPKIQSFGVNVADECVVPCYFARQDDVLVFDDVEVLNYKTLDPRNPFTYELLQIVVKKIAKFHAFSIILEEKLSEETGTTFRIGDHYPQEVKEGVVLEENPVEPHCFQAGVYMVDFELDLLSDLISCASLEDLKIKQKKAFKLSYELVKASTKFRNVICHGDLWVSNILIQHIDGKPTDARLIDFQVTRYCPPAHDLLILMHLTTTRSIRKQHWNDLVRLYYSQLSSSLADYGYDVNKIYPYGTFMESIEYMIPEAVCQTVVYYQMALPNYDIQKDHMYDEASSRNLLLGDRRDYLLDMIKRDPLFQARQVDALQDLEDICQTYF